MLLFTSDLKELLRQKVWILSFIAFVILFNIPFFPLGRNLSGFDLFVAWTVNLFALWALSSIGLCLDKKREKIFLVTLFLFTLIPNLIVFSYLFIAEIQMRSDMFWVIFASNASESEEYLKDFIPTDIIVGQSVYLVIAGFLFWKAWKRPVRIRLKIKKHKVLFNNSIFIIGLIISFQYLSNVVSLVDFYKSGVRFLYENYKLSKESASRKHIKFDITSSLSQTGDPATLVVIIGESLNRSHMHLYGYGRQTTPGLDSLRDELFVYTDVISPNTHTIAVLKDVLTFEDREHPEYYFDKPSVINLFKSGGFETYWISTQEFISKWGGSYGIIAQEADHVYDLSITKKTDEVVLPCLDEILQQKSEKDRIIFIHLMGNHHSYSSRYPEEYDHFDFDSIPIPYGNRPYLDDEEKQIIDEYDNSVLYVDYVVNEIIDKVKAEDSSSAVIFFSDHGEEVFDSRDFRGHSITSPRKPQCDIPFIVWLSNEYKAENTDIVTDEKRPYSTEHFIHSISNLGKLAYKDYNPALSLFSRRFVIQPRFVGDFNYTAIPE